MIYMINFPQFCSLAFVCFLPQFTLGILLTLACHMSLCLSICRFALLTLLNVLIV